MLRHFRTRLLLLAVLAAAPALAVLGYALWRLDRAEQARAREEAARLATAVAESYSLVAVGLERVLLAIALTGEGLPTEAGTCGRQLAALLQRLPELANLGVADASGRVTCSARPLDEAVSYGDTDWFRAALATNQPAFSGFAYGRIIRRPALFATVPLPSADGTAPRVLFGVIDLQQFDQPARRSALPAGATAVVLDDAGVVLARVPDHQRWLGQRVDTTRLGRAMLTGAGATVLLPGLEGVRRHFGLQTVELARGRLLHVTVGLPADVSAASRRAAMTAAAALVLALAGGLGLGTALLGRALESDVGALLQRADAMRSGESRFARAPGTHELSTVAAALDAAAAERDRQDVERSRLLDESERSRAALGASTRALEDALAEGAALLGALPLAVVGYSADQRILAWNPAAERLFGWPAAEAAGGPLPMIGQAHLEEHMTIRGRLLRGESIAGHLTRRLRKDGTEVPVALYGAPIRDAEGRVTAAVLIYEDVTERLEREAAVRRRSEALRRLSAKLLKAREEEQARISREIHDELGQQLTSLKLDAGWLRRHLVPGAAVPEAITERLRELDQLIDDAVGAARRLATQLRPPALDTLGVGAAIEGLAARWRQETGIDLALDLRPIPKLADGTAIVLYRIAQEALTNIARHSGARHAWIRLAAETADPAVTLRVSDDGRGMPPAVRDGALGLLGMRERAELAGGSVRIADRAGGGTEIIATVPLGEAG